MAYAQNTLNLLKEIKDEIEKLMVMPGGLKVLIVEDSTLFGNCLKNVA
jgi:hypothetical protein